MAATMEHKLVNGRWRWQPTSSGGGGLFSSYAKISDQKAYNAGGGTTDGSSNNTIHTRELNTEDFDPDGIVSISSNRFTLQAGTYFLRYSAPAAKCNSHKVFLYNHTDSANVADSMGRTQYTTDDTVTCDVAVGECRVTIASAKEFELKHRIQTAFSNSSALGYGGNVSGLNTPYATVEIWKEA